MDGTVIEKKASPYERIGGAEGVRGLVDAFYDTMERNPAYAELRACTSRILARHATR